ncbi:MAG: hypothetical protein OER88_12400, partial [Planctomycetota bacterium]|nr:hypothetical protein [Planctomycetota bacterium]
MRRCVLALLLAAAVAHGEDVIARVTAGDDPVVDAGVAVVPRGKGFVFELKTWEAQARTDLAGLAVVNAQPGDLVVVYEAGYAIGVRRVDGTTVDVGLETEIPFSGTVVDKDGQPIADCDVALKTTHRQ